MDSKKTIRQYIGPNWVVTIILCVIPFLMPVGLILLLCATIPTAVRAGKSIKKLEATGQLDKAAAQLTSPMSKRLMNGKLVLTDDFIIGKRTGYVFAYEEAAWVYKHRYTQRLFFIPISVTDSLYLATKSMKPKQVAIMGKDKLDEIKTAIIEIYNHNRSCLVGYTKESQVAYKQLTK